MSEENLNQSTTQAMENSSNVDQNFDQNQGLSGNPFSNKLEEDYPEVTTESGSHELNNTKTSESHTDVDLNQKIETDENKANQNVKSQKDEKRSKENTSNASSSDNKASETQENSNTENNTAKPAAKSATSLMYFWLVIFMILALLVAPGLSAVVAYEVAKNQFGNNKAQKVVETQEITSTRITNEESAVVEVASKARPSVVSVIISRDLSRFRNQLGDSESRNQVQVGAGTGFIVSSEGHIVTNRHVVDDERADYTVVFEDDTEISAKVLDRDPVLDIAILKIDTDRKLSPLPIGNSEKLSVGQSVVAIGNSLGQLSNTVSKGIISGLGRTITATNGFGENSETLSDIIQTDASINSGNSGGPLLDINGNVIGVNVARSSTGDNVAFSIAINNVIPAINSVIETGKIQRPYIGIRYRILNQRLSESLNLSVNYGAFVGEENTSVLAGSPAAKAGIKPGDIILELNNQQINQNNDLRSMISKLKVGQQVSLKILRGTEEINLNITLEAIPD